MAKILYGKAVSNEISKRMKERVDWLREKNIHPTLALVRVGENPDDAAYEKGLMKQCESKGIAVKPVQLSQDVSEESLLDIIHQLNENQEINGIMIFLPLPVSINETSIRQAISSDKDIDGINGSGSRFAPATPKAIMELLRYYGIELAGVDALIINSSHVVGRPLALMMLSEESTITVGHAKTKELKEKARQSEIVVSAVGRARLFNADYFSEKSIIIDVGINQDEKGNLCGDIDYEAVKEKVRAISPVPGGIGTVTTSVLLSHVVEACMMQNRFVQ